MRYSGNLEDEEKDSICDFIRSILCFQVKNDSSDLQTVSNVLLFRFPAIHPCRLTVFASISSRENSSNRDRGVILNVFDKVYDSVVGE